MPAPKSTTQPNARCWVWFKGDPLKTEGSWKGGWYGAPSVIGGVRIEHHDYVPCRVPEWRVVFSEPADLLIPPSVPDDAEWKLYPTEPQWLFLNLFTKRSSANSGEFIHDNAIREFIIEYWRISRARVQIIPWGGKNNLWIYSSIDIIYFCIFKVVL